MSKCHQSSLKQFMAKRPKLTNLVGVDEVSTTSTTNTCTNTIATTSSSTCTSSTTTHVTIASFGRSILFSIIFLVIFFCSLGGDIYTESFWSKTATFLCGCIFRVHRNDKNTRENVFSFKTLWKMETFRNDNFVNDNLRAKNREMYHVKGAVGRGVILENGE